VINRDPADGRGDYMMDEAMADLGSLLAVEAIEGAQAGERYRRTGYPGFNPDAYSALGYLKLAAAGFDTPLSKLPDSDLSFRLARSKGGRVWYQLSREIGAERFPAVIASVVRKHAFRPVTWTDFLKSIEIVAGRDLDWFYAQYFDRPGAPEWRLKPHRVNGGRVELTVEQTEPPFRARLPIELTTQAGAIQAQAIEVDGLRSSASLRAPAGVSAAALDPHFTWLRWTPDYREEAFALAGYTRARLAEGTPARLEILKDALAHVPTPDVYAARYQIEALIGTLLASQESWEESRVHLLAAIASPTTLPERLPLTYLRLATVAKALNDRPLLERAVAGAVAADAAVGNVTGAAEQARALLPQSPKD
jgi:hypothetical protein